MVRSGLYFWTMVRTAFEFFLDELDELRFETMSAFLTAPVGAEERRVETTMPLLPLAGWMSITLGWMYPALCL